MLLQDAAKLLMYVYEYSYSKWQAHWSGSDERNVVDVVEDRRSLITSTAPVHDRIG